MNDNNSEPAPLAPTPPPLDASSSPAPAPSSPLLAPTDLSAPAPPAAADPWKDRLKQNMVRDRKRLRRSLLVAAGLLALLAAIGLWWMYPGPAVPPLFAVAFDDVCLPGDMAHIRLQLEPLDPHMPFPKNLRGLQVIFKEEGNKPLPPLAKLVTDKMGRAETDVHFTEQSPVVRFTGRFTADRQFRSDQGRLFFLPPAAELILVDVQDLFADRALDLEKEDLNKVALHQPTGKLLNSQHSGNKQVVYLAVTSDTARGYHLARRWVAIQSLPSGPVLGRPGYHDDNTAADARQQISSELSRRWKVVPLVR